MTRLLFVLGTRPEIIKLWPLLRAAAAAAVPCHVVHTGQHHDPEIDGRFWRELALAEPEFHLGVGSLPPGAQLGAMLERLDPILAETRPDHVVVLGDTTSALAGALAASKRRLRLAHVEAGLRSWDRGMAEEQNRVTIDHLAELLFCPTELQRTFLLREAVDSRRVHVVGNTVADALALRLGDAGDPAATLHGHGLTARGFAFMTLHREENVDPPAVLAAILAGVGAAAAAARMPVVFPVHPRTARSLEQHGIVLPAAVRRVPLLSYQHSLHLQRAARVVLTDSGGLQEEAAILGVPCVTLRTSTERQETLACGANVLAGVSTDSVATAIARSLDRAGAWQHPYGDGAAAARILAALTAATPALPRLLPPATGALPSDGDHTGRDLGEAEIALVTQAIRSGTLNSTKGTFVTRLEQEFARRYGVRHAIACASGSAAVHCAVAALRPRAGDEFVTTPITDMGALTPILYERAVPVFADVDPTTLNVTAATLAARITPRTRALIVTHLFGLPCDMAPILALGKARGLPVIEDVAQAFFAQADAGRVGTLGALGTFSLQQGKHMTTGEGGLVVTDDPELARHVFLFVNKAWGYGDPQPDHYFPALNYRLTELQGAVAVAQLDKVEWVVARRRAVAARLTEALAGLPGVQLPAVRAGVQHVFWKYPLLVDPAVIPGGAEALGRAMKGAGVFCVPRYIQKPAFECALFQHPERSPLTQGLPVWRRADFPGTMQALERVIVLPINERYTPEQVAFVAGVIREQARRLGDRG